MNFKNHVSLIIENSNQPATKQVSASLHETIASIETLLENNCYNGNTERFYELVERCSDTRPVCI